MHDFNERGLFRETGKGRGVHEMGGVRGSVNGVGFVNAGAWTLTTHLRGRERIGHPLVWAGTH